MLKKIFKLFKKLVLSILILYGYNIVTQSFNLNVPINIYTILIITIFDGFGFLGLVSFYLLNFR